MTDHLQNRKGAPAWVQVLFLIAWLSTIASLNVMSQNLADANITYSPNDLRSSMLLSAVLVFLLPVAFDVFLIRRDNLSFLTLNKKIHPLWALSAIFVIIFALPAVDWLGKLNASFDLSSIAPEIEKWMKNAETKANSLSEILVNDKSTQGLIMNLFIMGFMAAFTEEIFFRATLQKTLTESKINPHVAIWITAILFSAFHIQFYGFLPRMFLGAVLGYLFFFTGNIWVSFIAHFLNNATIVLISFFTKENIDLNPLNKKSGDIGFTVGWPLAFLSILLVIGVFIFLQKMKKEKTANFLNEEEP